MDINKLKQKLKLFQVPILSFIICIYGLHVIKIYNIDLKQEIILSLDGFKNVISIVSGSNEFLKVLENNIVFKGITDIYIGTEKYGWILYQFLSLDIAAYVSWFLPTFRKSGSNKIPFIAKFLIDIIVNFFSIFLINHFIVLFFCGFPIKIYMLFLNYTKTYSLYLNNMKNHLLSILIALVRIIFIFAFIYYFMILPILEILVELFIFYFLTICFEIDNLPLWQTIFITALIRSGFKIVKCIKEDYF